MKSHELHTWSSIPEHSIRKHMPAIHKAQPQHNITLRNIYICCVNKKQYKITQHKQHPPLTHFYFSLGKWLTSIYAILWKLNHTFSVLCAYINCSFWSDGCVSLPLEISWDQIWEISALHCNIMICSLRLRIQSQGNGMWSYSSQAQHRSPNAD